MKIQKQYSFKNWARNIQVEAPLFAQPVSEHELIELIRNHSKIRVVGTGHSWSDHFSRQGLMINLDRYNRVLHLDKSAQTIKVQAGIILWELNQILHKEGLALINLGSIKPTVHCRCNKYRNSRNRNKIFLSCIASARI